MMISVKNLSFAYTDTKVISDVSVDIERGERWAVIGKNGAGKSTLLRCLAGLENRFTGTISIRGEDIGSYKPRALAKIITYVPQSTGKGLPLIVYDYVMMGRFAYHGFLNSVTAEDRKSVTEALELTDTAGFRLRTMNTLSGGELQRVLIAGAVSQRTDVMLLDEPATFLDPLHQNQIQLALNRIHAEYKTTIVIVTHDINSALFHHEKTVALVNGSVYYSGTTEALVRQYAEKLRAIYGIAFTRGVCQDTGRSFLFPKDG